MPVSTPIFSLRDLQTGEVIQSDSEALTVALGETLSQGLQPGDVVAFFGDLGSGKTTMISGVCRGLQVCDQVSSPTFTLINEYQGRVPVYHFDFYRIRNAHEAWSLGLDEYFGGDGICLIEWSEKIIDLLPLGRIEVHVEDLYAEGVPGVRKIRFEFK